MPSEDRDAELMKQGRPPWGGEMKIADPNGELVPRDGESSGMLWIRGPWVASRYFKHEQENVLDNGWFPTGDIATWDRHGFVKITDRTKDVIKSGGEWISSIDIENIAMLHPKVRFAAAVAAYHPKMGRAPGPDHRARRRGDVERGGNARISPSAPTEMVAAGRGRFCPRIADDGHWQDYEGQTALRLSELSPPSLVTRTTGTVGICDGRV